MEERVIKKLRNNFRILNHIELIKRKEESYSELEIGVIELHLTQKCDLKCFYCSYGSNKKSKDEICDDFPFEQLDKILNLNPKAIVFAGGGEPLLYNYKGKTIEDVIEYIKLNKPNCRIGLITNGNRAINKKVSSMLDWIRISLDATNITDFHSIKSGDFSKRIDSIKENVSNGIQYVGIGLLYNRFNFKNMFNDCIDLYNLLNENLESNQMNSINFQYRATCPIESCECPSLNYENKILMTPNKENWWNDLVIDIKDKYNSIDSNSKFGRFLRLNTNMSDVFKNKYNSSLNFNKCYVALSRWIISSDGNIYPCVMKITNKNNEIGNIFNDSKDKIIFRERNYYNLNEKFCSGSKECCKINGNLNDIVEENYNNDFEISNIDVFF